MVAKPYSPSHIGAVAAHYTEMRLSGAVKERLVELLCEELDRLVPTMEEETLTQDPERKTLDDPNRSRLNYNRTRELMIDRIDAIDSVGSAAVQAGIEHIEKHLAKLLRHAGEAASRDRVNTIKPRHLDHAVSGLGLEDEGKTVALEGDEETATNDFVASQSGGVVTASSLLSMARSIAKMTVTKDALEELIDTYTMVLEELESDIRKHAQLGSNPVHFIESINNMRGMMSLGWMRSMLTKAAQQAQARGSRTIDVEDIIHIDPFE
ncbi:MAG: hypothetical protein L7S56_02200 [Candidatus Poseidonia sp.]|nr:hypothetical protein [Poseidonia sp.]